MTTSRADLLAGVDMEGGENFCDSVYNFLKNQGKDINLLTNSGFGVWSQSDANKGLGTLVYDNLAVATFEVGEAITTAAPPGGSGATGKVITNIGTTLVLGACTGRFNDNEQITGADSGATADVNMPDAATGVDEVRNGEFEAGVGGWTAVDCALASIAGGYVGNCLQITRTGGANQYAHQTMSLTNGKIYKIFVYVKSGTSGNEAFEIFMGSAGYVSYIGASTGAWVLHTITFEADSGAANYGRIYVRKKTATAGTMLFDEVAVYEITPCCTAGDAVAFDGWQKDVGPDLYREHNGVNTKDGSFYALAIVPTTAGHDAMVFPRAISALEEWYMQFQGRPVTFGMWVLAYSASHARIRIQDSVDSTYSDYHTGGGDYEWLEVTKVIDAGATAVLFKLTTTLAGDIDGTTLVYVSQDMAVFGWSLGEGMYQPRLQELVLLDSVFLLNSFNASTISADANYNLEAESDARLPKGAKMFYARLYGINAVATSMFSTVDDTTNLIQGIYMICPVNAQGISLAGFQKCDANGDFGIVRTGTWTSVYINMIGVQVN